MTLENELIDLYGALLLDANLMFAIVLAWAITAFVKQAPFIINTKPIAARRWKTRLVSAFIGFCCVLFMKRDLLITNTDHVVTFAVIVAFTHGFIYMAVFAIMKKLFPGMAQIIKGKR